MKLLSKYLFKEGYLFFINRKISLQKHLTEYGIASILSNND